MELTYAGERCIGNKMHYSFSETGADSTHHFQVGKRKVYFSIGHQYDLPFKEDMYTITTENDKGEVVDAEKIREWSALDKAARYKRSTDRAVKKLSEDSRKRWEKALEPLIKNMRHMSPSERSAIRLMVMEMLF